MENLIIYLVKTSGLLAVFLLAYHALLRKETFFNTNRWYLLAGLITSSLLPLLTYTKIVWVDPAPMNQYQPLSLEHLMMLQQTNDATVTEFSINWFDVFAGMYISGSLFFLLKFILDLRSLHRIIKGHPMRRSGKYILVDSPKIESPFSFFNYIVYNSALLQPEELESIICHEKVHSSQKHSIDMIVGQLFCIAFWFNPFVWMYKKSISQNLEFIADAEATKLIADKKAYQKTLLKITVQPECIAITNHFYQSLIKKRIVMLNKQQSKKRNSWKYAIVLPALAAFMLLFQVRTVAQEKEGTPKIISEKTKLSIEVTKDSKDEELEANKNVFKDQFNTEVNFENIKRNQNKEITAIKVTVADKGQSQVYEVAGNSPISPFTIEVEKDNSGRSNISFGTGHDKGRIKANAFIIDNNNDSIRLSRRGAIKLGPLDAGTLPPAPQSPPAIGHWSVNRLKIGNDDLLVIVDGVKQKKGTAAIEIPVDREIDQMNILKGKEAKKKYGKDAKEGAVEITTKRGGSKLKAYRFEMPDLPNGDVLNFNFEMPEIPNMPDMTDFNFDFGNFEDFDGAFIDGELIPGDKLSPEERERIREDVKKVREELRKKLAEFDSNKLLQGQQLKRENREEARKEIEEARKEMEKARKELEEARKELQKTRANMNKKV